MSCRKTSSLVIALMLANAHLADAVSGPISGNEALSWCAEKKVRCRAACALASF